jgi:hypothetical protein
VCVYSIDVIPQQSVSAFEENENHQSANGKFLKDGQLFILWDGKTYTVSGAEVK